ncbi:MAG: hypothetical protein MZW92_81415 [Comamonadaceae bacterium]|nr:hypothetical protein [Comamonadaceae bacterium]
MGSQPFQASRYWVSNGEFHAFVTAGGYREPALLDGNRLGVAHASATSSGRPSGCRTVPPACTVTSCSTLFEVIDMPWDWPVEVNDHEAQGLLRVARRAGQARPTDCPAKPSTRRCATAPAAGRGGPRRRAPTR